MPEINGQLATKEIFPDADDVTGSIGLLNFLWGAGDIIPPWWSVARDNALRCFAKEEDHLAGTIETFRETMVAIPFRILPRDTTIKAHHALAQAYQDLFAYNFMSRSNPVSSGYGDGLGPFLEDAWTQDNGAFIAIEGAGSPNGPVIGVPTKLIHLDSARCWRTGSSEFPILFQDYDGAQYRVHKTRLLSFTFGSSSIASMLGVGFCSVSRAIHATQIFKDISHYKQEKLGSRQRRGILIGDGIQTEAIESALSIADEALDNMGLSRYGQMPIIGSRKQGISLSLVDLISLPDGFNNVEEYQLGMHVLALAFGVDVRQLGWAMGVAGQTKADALIQHVKQRGKGPGYIITELTRKIEIKILPRTLKIEFDRQDDEQDRAEAEIANIRSQVRERDVGNGISTIRATRQQMVEKGEIDPQQFEEMELSDGRLPDGRPVTSLFGNKEYAVLLNLGVDNLNRLLDRGGSSAQMTKVRQSLAALEALTEDNQEIQSTEQNIVNDEEVIQTKDIKTFRQDLRDNLRDYYVLSITRRSFVMGMSEIVTREFEDAWLKGMKECGQDITSIDDLSPDEREALLDKTVEQFPFIENLADDIDRDIPLETYYDRLDLWTRRFDEIAIRAKLMACPDDLFEWTLGPTEHCESCRALEGYVMTAQEWLDSGVLPQVANATYLICQGFKCRCNLRKTTKPRTNKPLPVRSPRLEEVR